MKLPVAARAYIAATAAVALFLLVYAGGQSLSWHSVLLLTLIYALSASSATFAGDDMHVSVSLVVGLAAILVAGPYGAAIVCSAQALEYKPGLALVKRVFNGAVFPLTAYVAGMTYSGLGGPVGQLGSRDFPGVLGIVVVTSLAYFIVNVTLVGLIVALARQGRVDSVLREASWITPSYLAYGLVGLLMAELWENVGVFSTLLLLVPLLVARWAFAQYAAERKAYDATVRALVQAIETKDYYTRGHSERVARGVDLIAREIGMVEERASALHFAGVLHDVGKLSVPTSVLQKEGSLTDEEFDAIRAHPALGLEVVRDIEFLSEAYEGILHHHERLDGRGYPHGLSGDDIPEFARIIGVADSFDAMTSNRSYRGARTQDEAIAELRRCAGTQFDPAFVDAFICAVERDGLSHVASTAALDAIAEEMLQSGSVPPPRMAATDQEPAVEGATR